MKNVKKIVAIVLLLALAALVCFGCNNGGDPTPTPSAQTTPEIPDTDTYLAKDGASDYKIVIPQNATAPEEYAASELVTFFKEATGVTLQVVSDEGITHSESNKYISIGETAIKSAVGLSATDLGKDGFRIKRYGNTVVTAAYNERAKIYAVYQFMTIEFGFEVYAADEIFVEKTTALKLKDIDFQDAPSFTGRQVQAGYVTYDKTFAVRLRTTDSTMVLDAKYGGGSLDEWCGWAHTFYNLLPPDTYKDAHPEWYQGGQLCLTNDELLDEMTASLKQKIVDNPGKYFFGVAQEDMGSFCSCENCREAVKKYTQSGVLVRFLNKLDDRIQAWLKEEQGGREICIVTFAYHETLAAPVVATENGYVANDPSVIPHDTISIRFTPIEACYFHSYNDENCTVNATNGKAIAGWKAISNNVTVWQYGINYSHYLLPFDNLGVMQENYLALYDMGAYDVLDQMAYNTNVTSMGALKSYLQAKLMWNVNDDFDALYDNFMRNYYKDVCDDMCELFDFIRLHYKAVENEWKEENKSFHIRLFDSYTAYLTGATVWDRRSLEQALAICDGALEKISAIADEKTKNALTQRVMSERICFEYLVLNNYASFYDISAADYERRVNKFADDAIALGITNLGEGGSLSSYIDALREKIV